MITNSKKAALEMSIGTIVTIVLVVTTMILGLVLIRSIFTTGTNAVDNIDSAIQDEINKLFADEGRALVVYPASRQFTIDRGDDPKGFAFSVKNNDGTKDGDFTYAVTPNDVSRCGASFGKSEAEQMLIGSTGSFNLGPGATLGLPRLVLLEAPESAPQCTLTYTLQVNSNIGQSESADVFITIN